MHACKPRLYSMCYKGKSVDLSSILYYNLTETFVKSALHQVVLLDLTPTDTLVKHWEWLQEIEEISLDYTEYSTNMNMPIKIFASRINSRLYCMLVWQCLAGTNRYDASYTE